MIELSDRPADMLVRKLRKESRNPDLSPEHTQVMNRAADMINSLDTLTYQCVVACKRMGFVYDESDKKYSEFSQAFFWLQEKGADAYNASMADGKYEFLKGVESRMKDLIAFYEENKRG
ncbi:hypothetical protein Hena1_02040 [Erwinia phage Hena1]|uniref:Uncharacterized protein n=1 Tax=Erwinia phage Hena1 TaxID=2678601 RepID=A0A6B9J8E6_9CAUD|nr:hypothetical protein HWC84_gp160 [Erwinia phage Hena1]QGZ16354.1 hypothetical protein Hena1_02040 [Erwinia phage Hena1]